ncbi:MAG: YaiI/YqxD family protein [Bacillota bacterium]|mgnify:CR=1 FL=1|jgi:uncharacterized protein YaiI (UPF0178 family)
MKILVDADSCPVKELISRIASEYQVPVWLVASLNHQMPHGPGIRVVQVDAEAQAVDLEIIRQLKPGDVVVTQDFGLATVALAQGGRCLSPRGMVYSQQNIDSLLMQRHLAQRYRRGGGRLKGPSAIQLPDKKRFELELRRLLDEMGETNE